MTAKTRSIDLDAARRERDQPEGFPVTLRGKTYTLPSELPVDVFDPFLTDDFDLAGLIRDAMVTAKDENGVVKPTNVIVVEALFERPSLPVEVIKAIYASLELLFGKVPFGKFKAARPTFGDYSNLVQGLFSIYGASMGEAFGSADSSVNAGPTPNPTSTGTAVSTPEPSGANPEPEPASSGLGG